jgi:hypothetical protein
MSDETKKIIIPAGHKPPVSRRDFLRYGLLPFAGHILAPNFLTQVLLQNTARAQGLAACGGAGGSGYLPFLVIDLAGGAGLPGNFLVGKSGGPKDLIRNYETLGWDPRASGSLDESFGLPMAANNVSQILMGIKNSASPQTLAKFRMGSLCSFSQDDTSVNRTSALTLVSRAGLKGRFLENATGSVNSLSGGNSSDPLKDTALKPVFIKDALDVQNSISHGPAFNTMPDSELQRLTRSVYEMSSEQMRKFENLPEHQKLSQIAECGYKPTLDYGKIIQGLNPMENQNASQVYRLRGQTSEQNAVFAAIVYNVLQGNTGPGAITMGGYDYHDKGQPFTDQKDLEAGQQIGQALELAARLNKPLFIQLITDGGVSSLPGTRTWTSDSNVRSMTVIGYFNPNGAPEQRQLQVGEYTDGGTVNQNTIIGDEPAKVANAVLANYLSASGKLGEFDKVAQTPIRASDLESVLIF